MLLSTAQAVAAIADVGLITVLERGDELVCVGDARRAFDIGLARTRCTECDVVRHGVVEQDAVLGNNAHERTQVGDAQIADVMTIDEQGAAGDIEEARQQIGERGLSAAAGAYQRNALPLLHR